MRKLTEQEAIESKKRTEEYRRNWHENHKKEKKEYDAKRYEDNKEEIKKRVTQYRKDGRVDEKVHVDGVRKRTQKNKLLAIEYKGGKCFDCGLVDECPDVYEFHHLNPKEKDRNIGQLIRHKWDKIKIELDKCDLLCSNCHKKRHWKERNGR